jgi:DNA-binding LacI/PurR family transcriptional regulator
VRFLKGGKINAIGVTPPGAYGVEAAFANPYLRQLLRGVAQVCDQRGASLTLVTGVGEDNTWGIRNAVVDGFIIHRFEEAAIIEARRRDLPCVFVDMDGDRQASSVRIDDRNGARLAASHLIALGHTKVAIFSVLREIPSEGNFVFHSAPRRRTQLSSRFALDRDRLAGYLDAFEKVGLKANDIPIVETWADVPEAATDGAAALLDAVPEITAVLAMTDVQALGVMAEAQRRELRVPEDLSIIGFDDIPESALSHPPLTTISHPITEKGSVAAELLFDETARRHVVLPVSLVERASVAAPPSPKRRRLTR